MQRKTAYELSQSQVSTPKVLVELFWTLVQHRRAYLDTVLDLGAGDCRFAFGGSFREYVGIEIDPERAKMATLPSGGQLLTGCAFRHKRSNYDACIGNPPYVRHHDIESPWQEQVHSRIATSLGVTLNGKCNLFVYFLCLAAMKTKEDGLIAMIVPYEWVSRPSSKAFRDFVENSGWQIDVYRFSNPVFDDVLTTASITIIDKSVHSGAWQFFDVDTELNIRRRRGPTRSGSLPLQHQSRGAIWAMRGLSPGSQKYFTLTEGERIHNGLSRRDVAPCVTTLRHVPHSVRTLTKAAFERYFVGAGARCWLIRSCCKKHSAALEAYLAEAPASVRSNYTCSNREPWFAYQAHPVPQLLISSGFVQFGPKTVRNLIGAHSVGSVSGVYVPNRYPVRKLQDYLRSVNFERKIIAHAKTLKKLEIGQLNSVLNAFAEEVDKHGR